ncbi:acyl-CoA dehydrogenase family protein [Brevibacillus ruminantium]|uniref:Acyl-CoA dehydrogenase family protein n=1 Tax=Brevibacillus ruminantium TaxID=2950604 RepID=A0ABY4W9L1_9BACL|nr:acyl-CoA dehydrogenase family protein [Brevibacillus ruminantium]USG63738.1 acyl-CoA dehydrogenase family protein [Brevibacillus ruminantium]
MSQDRYFVMEAVDTERIPEKRCKVKEGLRQLDPIIEEMRRDAQLMDERGTVPHQHVEALRRIGYPAWNVPEEYGGKGMPLSAWLQGQERLAQANPSVALGIGWHMGTLHDLAWNRP